MEYGSNRQYMRMVIRAIEGFHRWNALFEETLYHETRRFGGGEGSVVRQRIYRREVIRCCWRRGKGPKGCRPQK